MHPLAKEAARRRTFAIISHPDAGKTTLTEKLLLYGGAIHLAGSVKARRAARHATSDWMELEKKRGISVTSSVMQFPYRAYQMNLLDTPGHQDFGEDTYRTLVAVDSAVMLIDAAKGVEPQTKKLFKVCRMRDIPIFTFINKMDRHGRDPLELIDELEQIFGIRSCPMNWPIGMGPDFKGVYERQTGLVHLFSADRHGEVVVEEEQMALDHPDLIERLGEDLYRRLLEDIEMLDVAGDPYDLGRIRQGQLTPLFFGSAMNNFGVRLFLDSFVGMAPGPGSRPTTDGEVSPEEERFSGFVFKIQANMNPQHRDCLAFLRICSGRFTPGMKVYVPRLGKEIRLAQTHQLMAQERILVEEAYAGDIVGIFDSGQFRIGDTLNEGGSFRFEGIPRFSPEHFAVLRMKDPSKRKQLKKGLDQLAEEGAIQVFYKPERGEVDPILGAVGQLQFDVFSFRLQSEYGVETVLEPLPYQYARWVEGKVEMQHIIDSPLLEDRDGSPVLLFKSEWALERFKERNSHLVFHETTPIR